jgi:hypothetical protein
MTDRDPWYGHRTKIWLLLRHADQYGVDGPRIVLAGDRGLRSGHPVANLFAQGALERQGVESLRSDDGISELVDPLRRVLD